MSLDVTASNQSELRLFQEEGSMMFPVQEVCGGKGLIDKYLAPSLYLTIWVIIHWALGFPQGYLQGSGSLRRGAVLMETGQMPLIEWRLWSKNWQTWSGCEVQRIQGGHGS
jgi:hypothetical protein